MQYLSRFQSSERLLRAYCRECFWIDTTEAVYHHSLACTINVNTTNFWPLRKLSKYNTYSGLDSVSFSKRCSKSPESSCKTRSGWDSEAVCVVWKDAKPASKPVY